MCAMLLRRAAIHHQQYIVSEKGEPPTTCEMMTRHEMMAALFRFVFPPSLRLVLNLYIRRI